MPCINVHLGFSCIWDFQARHMQEDMVPFWNCICVSAQSRSVGVSTLGVNGRQLNETSKRVEGPSPRLPFFFFNLRGAIQSLGDAEHYMCREWLDAAWARNILCRSPVYHQSGVQADDQALKYVRHIKYHFMLCDFWGRGICTLTLVHLQGSEIMQGDPEVCTTYHMAWWKWTLLGQAEWFLPCTEYSVPMLYYSNLIPDIVWLAFSTE
jgi:hypothetical protein